MGGDANKYNEHNIIVHCPTCSHLRGKYKSNYVADYNFPREDL